MLKELNKRWLKALRQQAAWHRWHRKLPHNRVHRPRVRNDQGWTIGYGEPVPIPEPKLPAAFCRRVELPSGMLLVQADDHGVEAAYRNARRPRPTPEEVAPMAISEEKIRQLYQQCGA